jgi:hypothetical protein
MRWSMLRVRLSVRKGAWSLPEPPSSTGNPGQRVVEGPAVKRCLRLNQLTAARLQCRLYTINLLDGAFVQRINRYGLSLTVAKLSGRRRDTFWLAQRNAAELHRCTSWNGWTLLLCWTIYEVLSLFSFTRFRSYRAVSGIRLQLRWNVTGHKLRPSQRGGTDHQ